MSLTASDGTGLKLVRLEAGAVVMDPLAFTEVKLTFENPLDRTLEGQFRITLPPGATISRFAMKVGEKWQEGEVVEKQAARRAYEDFLHRRQDPALLEQAGGNEFQARVFPIPPRGQKELILSYSHDLVRADAAYVLPLKGLPQVGELIVNASGVTGEAQLLKTNFVPNADFVAQPQRAGNGVRAGDLVAVRVVPVADTAPEALTSLTLLVDSSASRALGWKEQTQLVQALMAALGRGQPRLHVNLVAFDQEVVLIYEGPASRFGEADLKRLRDRQALGASNIELALKYLADRPTPRAVIISDGVLTAGVTEGNDLSAQVLKLKSEVTRLDAIAVGGIRDEVTLARLAQGGLPKDGAVLDSALGAPELARRLQLATKSKLAVSVEGAKAVWPTTLSGIQAGDAVLLYSQAPQDNFQVTVGGVKLPAVKLNKVDRPLLERAWARARISALEEKLNLADGAAQKQKLKDEIVSISTKERVLSSLTALLVLETEDDYRRFNIDRRALADILTVEKGKVARLKRDEKSLVVARAPEKPKPAMVREKAKESKKMLSASPPAADEAPATMAPPAEPAAEVAESEPAPVEESRSAPAPSAAPPPPRPARADRSEERMSIAPRRREAPQQQEPVNPYTGTFSDVMTALKTDKNKALSLARGWREEQPGDLLALVALGEVLEARGELPSAARAYGSIIDLFPARADLRRFAGVRLERLDAALALAIDSFRRAVEQRPDHPASHRLLAFALVKAGQHEQAFEVMKAGAARQYPAGRFAGVDRILREDLGLIAAAWVKAEPQKKAAIMQKLKDAGGVEENQPSLRFVLNWETDANDVDFHIYDSKGGHAYYSQRQLQSGGELYADVTTGYGPECFTIRLPKNKRAGPYKLQAHYYSIGPMGAGMGKLQLIEHDGNGGLRFEERPYVVMVNRAFVDLGEVKP